MISLAKKWNCPDKITDIRTRQAKGAKFQHTLGTQYTAANLSFIIVIRNGKIVWKHGPYCRCFPLNLKYPGWPYRAYIKIAKNGNFCKEWLSENDIEAVLATFCCYDHGAKAFEAVQKIATDQEEYRKRSSCVIIWWIAKLYL